MEACDALLCFGTKNYGEDTGNAASTYHEVHRFVLHDEREVYPLKSPRTPSPQIAYWQNHVKNKSAAKKTILLRMIDWDDDFDHITARVLCTFPLNLHL